MRIALVVLAVLALAGPAFSHTPRGDSIRGRVHPCLAQIVDRENPSWDPTVYNRQGSGAYGLPQALPGHKMASAGADWRTNPYTQLRWMLRYVNERYGGPCEALAFWRAHRWY